ncbi:hypothetical protein [Vibrio tetraodonis]|uniref:hypothetical protein n=1 Tax=Vibrio tetraodonis TaxID=2231647 RepID=UPI0013B45D3B
MTLMIICALNINYLGKSEVDLSITVLPIRLSDEERQRALQNLVSLCGGTL